MTEYEKAYNSIRSLHITNKKGMIVTRKKGSKGYHDGMRIGTSTEWLKIVKTAEDKGQLKKVSIKFTNEDEDMLDYGGYLGWVNEYYFTAHMKDGSTVSYHIVHMYEDYIEVNGKQVFWEKWFVPDEYNSKIYRRLTRTSRPLKNMSGNLAKGRFMRGLI